MLIKLESILTSDEADCWPGGAVRHQWCI